MKDKTKGVLLISLAVLILLITAARVVLTRNATEERKTSSKVEETQEEIESEENVPIETNKESEEIDYLTGTDLPDEYYINPDFKITGLTEELKDLVHNKTDELNLKIQEYLYLYGYVGLPQAIMKEYTQISSNNQVVITFTTGLQNEITLQAVFSMTDETWNITTF